MKDRVRWQNTPRQVYRPAPRARGRRDDEIKGFIHTFVCPACHAILKEINWFVDEEQYWQIEGKPGVWPALCPGCLKVARGTYDAEVILRSPLLIPSKSAALDLISKEEERARRFNPLARLTALEDFGDEIQVLTTTPALAERIGRAFRKVYEGDLDIQPSQTLCRVRWCRE